MTTLTVSRFMYFPMLSRLSEPEPVVENSTLNGLHDRGRGFHGEIWQAPGFRCECTQLVDHFSFVKLKYLHSFKVIRPIQCHDGVFGADPSARRQMCNDGIFHGM